MKNYFSIMRISHWTKNVFVFVGLIFGGKLAGTLEETIAAVAGALGAFICFCLASSAVYIFNDIIDRNVDRKHPQKQKRLIAAGTVPVGSAAVICFICASAAVLGSFFIVPALSIIILAYIIMMFLYSVLFKRLMILDCIIISVGFCLRAVAGAVAVGVTISPWLIICTFALCLFLAFSKRRSEAIMLGDNSEAFRNTLAGYTPELLAHMLDVTSGLAVVCFLLYAMDDRTLRIFGTNNLAYTTPLVLYCIFRFSTLIQKGAYVGPVELILQDKPFQIGAVVWVLSCMAIIYADKLGLNISSAFTY